MKKCLSKPWTLVCLFLFFLLTDQLYAQPFTVNAGADFRINRKDGFAMLKGSINQPTATEKEWRCLNRPNGRPEIANILNPTRDTSMVIVLPPDYTGYYDFELKATYNAVTKRDTVRVFVDWGTYPPQANGAVIRMATVLDILAIPNCTLGDAVITGANDGPGFLGSNKIDIYFNNPAGISITAGHHLWIPAGQYNSIYLNFDSLQLNGAPNNPVIITNYGGQVECTQLILRNARYTKLTGKYVPGVSGNVNYKGHDGGYAYSNGKYGIYCNPAWTNISGAGIRVKGKWVKGLEVEYVEAANGNFACTMVKEDAGPYDYDSIYFHDNYFHDSHGEANYWGSTAGDPQHQFNYARFINNRVIRAGNELMQFNNQGHDNYVENNIFAFGALNWRSPFEAFNQANAIQLAVRNGKNYFRNNLVRGCGDQLISMFSQNNDAKYVSNGDTCHVSNNLLDYSKGFIASYIGGSYPCTNVKTNFSNNVLGRNFFMGDSIYTTAVSAGINTNNVLRTANGSTINNRVILKNNIRDNSKTVYSIQGNPLDSSGNTVTTIPFPAFQNSGFADNLNYNKFDMWADSLFNTWKNEYGAPEPGQRYNQPVYYQPGDYVTFLSKIYKCKQTHTSRPPAGVTDNYWELQTWTDGANTYTNPPDDYRLITTDYYRTRKMGLLDTLAGPNQPPTANAGIDITITLPISTVTLNGSGFDPDGIITNYQWTKIAGPTTGGLINPTSALSPVAGLVQGVYKFELIVTDNYGATGRDTMQVTVNPAPNQPPTALAGLDQVIILPGSGAILTGAGVDLDGSIVGYQWAKIAGPAAGAINTPASAQTLVTGLVQGVYQFELTVTDNDGATGKDTMQVTVALAPPPNQPPVANAGNDITLTLPANSTPLNGSGFDPDGSVTAYLWTKLTGPTTGGVINATSPVASLVGLVQGVYTYELMVTDNNGATGRDTVKITVNPPPNQPPTANAGNDITITLPINTAPLNGSGTDNDGNITAYQWTKIAGPTAGTVSNPASAQTSATGLVQGVYKFELTVTDNSGATDKDTMQVTVNPAPPPNQSPAANAGPDITITLPINTAVLNGSGFDPDGSITAYQWTKLTGPTTGGVINGTSAVASVVGLVQGVYTYELMVTDNNGATGRDTMRITVNPVVLPNQPPTANAGADITITLPINTAILTGSGFDPDGSITAYQWTKLTGPTTGGVINANSALASVVGLVQGIYTYELMVTDNNGATARDTMRITVNPAVIIIPVNIPPVADAGADINLVLPGNATPLRGAGTDADGIVVAYQWRVISASGSHQLLNGNMAQAILSNLQQGVYTVELTVTDNLGATGRDTVSVTVSAARFSPEDNNLKVFPNPVQGILKAELTIIDINRKVILVLTDAAGAKVYQEEFFITQSVVTENIDMSRFRNGSYVLTLVLDNGKKISRKIIKM